MRAAQGFFGTGKEASFENESQIMKIPHFRNLYQKVGMFGMPNVDFNLPGDGSHQGDQVRGVGCLHDGSIDTIFRFFTADVFRNPGLLFNDPSVGFDGGDPQRQDVEALMLAFDSDLAPIVGQQVTLTSTNLSSVINRITLLEQRAEASFVSAVLGGNVKECDLVAHLAIGGVDRGLLYNPNTNAYVRDSSADPALTPSQLRSMANRADQEVTYTCVPPGSGTRIALDRDGDGVLNMDELAAFTDPANLGSVPGACNDGVDNDGDGLTDLGLDSGCSSPTDNQEGCTVVAVGFASSNINLAWMSLPLLVLWGRRRRRC